MTNDFPRDRGIELLFFPVVPRVCVAIVGKPRARFGATLCKFGRANDRTRVCSGKMFIISKPSSLCRIPLSLLIPLAGGLDFHISRRMAALGLGTFYPRRIIRRLMIRSTVLNSPN